MEKKLIISFRSVKYVGQNSILYPNFLFPFLFSYTLPKVNGKYDLINMALRREHFLFWGVTFLLLGKSSFVQGGKMNPKTLGQ